MGGGGSIAKRDGVKINTNEGLDSPSSPSNFYSVSSQAAVALDTSLKGGDRYPPAGKMDTPRTPPQQKQNHVLEGGESKKRERKVGVVLLHGSNESQPQFSPPPPSLPPSLCVANEPCTSAPQ